MSPSRRRRLRHLASDRQHSAIRRGNTMDSIVPGSGDARRSEERLDGADDVVALVDLVDQLPAVERGAGVGDAEGQEVTDLEGGILRHFDVSVLVVEADDG